MGLVFVTGLVLLFAALSLLRGARERSVAFAAELSAPARRTAHEPAEPVADLVLPDPSAAEPDPVLAPPPAPVPAEPAPLAPPSTAAAGPDAPAAPAAPPRAGGLLSGTVVDGATGAPCAAEIWLSIPGSPSTNLVVEAAGGAFEQRVETPGAYALVARCGGKVGVLRDVHVVAGGRTEDLVVALREAARLRVAFDADGADRDDGDGEAQRRWTCTVYAEDVPIGLIVGADAELAVPPGALTVRLSAPGSGERRERTVTAAPGELTVVRFD